MTRREDTDARRSRPALSRERIVKLALRVLDREGLGALSMRRLADELGVGTMTIYGYFRSKDELLEAVVDTVADEHQVDSVALAELPWRERLVAVMRSLRDALVAHPALIQLRLTRPIATARAFRLTEVGMRALRDAGFTDREAARAFRSLFLYTFGFAAFNVHDADARAIRETRAALAELPARDYPVLSESAGELAATLADEGVFDYGLERLLDGLETRPAPTAQGGGKRRTPSRRASASARRRS